MDDLLELQRYVDVQKKTFAMMPFHSDFNSGIIEGLNLVGAYIKVKIDRLAINNAEANDVASGK